MRILVTGGAGYIGSHATRLFLAQGHETWVFDNLSRGHREAVPMERLFVGDLRDRSLLEEIFQQQQIEAVVHFAGLTYVGESVQDPGRYYDSNVCGTLHLLEAARACNVKRIVFSSTAAVYGNPSRVPICETELRRPINPYGQTKSIVEQMLEDYARAYGFGYAALRYFNAAGADDSGELGEDHDPETHLIPLVLQVALGRRSQIDIFGTDYPTPDGTCVRDYIHVNDLAAAHLLALEQIKLGSGQALNLGTGRGYSVREVVQLCREVTGSKIDAAVVAARAGDPAELVACPNAARRALGWEARHTDLRDIIQSAWNWHRTHPHGYRTSTSPVGSP